MAQWPLTEAQSNLPYLMDQVTQSHQPIVITGAESNAVLLCEADWASRQETLYLLSVPSMGESIKPRLTTPTNPCNRG